ncbi:hypothetical protein KCP69_00305 [Salmonella enterica subsp. enterica]|nr:hypothetical protein KCP69_00305 [Salmonella enterica subsp. enterica]
MAYQALRNQLNSLRQREAERALESTELLAENSCRFEGIVEQFKVKPRAVMALNQQAQRMDLVAFAAATAACATSYRCASAQYVAGAVARLGVSNMLGEALRAQVARLMPKPQQLDTEMAQLRVHRMRYEELLNKQPQLRQIRQATDSR